MPLECVAFILIRDGAVLAERRKATKRLLPNTLALPGGHLVPGETRKAGLERELIEELGIRPTATRYVCARIHRAEEARRIHYFAIESWLGDIACHEAESLHWIPVQELERLDFKVDREAVAAFLALHHRGARQRIGDSGSPAATEANAHRLRANLTDAERKLWIQLRGKLVSGVRFRRQVPIGRYVVDFVCLPARLIVEIDGGQHASGAGRDAERTAWLEGQGFTVTRFWNNDVLGNTRAVVESIRRQVDEALKTPPPAPSRKGRG